MTASTLAAPRFGAVGGALRSAWGRPRLRWWVLSLLSATGWAVALAALVIAVRDDGGLAYDAQAYWLAGRNVLDGNPLYWPAEVDTLGAYKYPPVFAQLWAPLALLPELAFSWLWRLLSFLCLRWLAGSWRAVGLWLLLPYTLTELSLANVTFPVAVMTVLAFRRAPWLAAWAGALKFGPALVIPYVWLTRPAARRSICLGVASVAAACGVSLALDPRAWSLYAASFGWQSGSAMDGAGVIALLPTGLADFALRVAIALVLVAIAVPRRSERLVFLASIVAVPILAAWRFAPALVLPRLPRLVGTEGSTGAATVPGTAEGRAAA